MNEHSHTLTDPTVDAALAAASEVTAPDAAEAAAAAPGASEAAARPDGVPEKFWDPEAGALRTEALLKSYLELERRLGGEPAGGPEPEPIGYDDPATPPAAEDETETPPAANIPEHPDGYEIATESELVAADPEVNKRLHEAGFTQEQAQLVYKLAEDYLLPAVSEAYGEVFVQQELGRLEQAFGGTEGWQATAEQLRTWGKANLAGDVYETLASSYDGVMAMHQMMQAREPRVVHADAPAAPADEGQLRRMMQDPRYWRDRDPAYVSEVTRGFERLFRD